MTMTITEKHATIINEIARQIAQGTMDISDVALPTRTSMNADQNGNILVDKKLLAWIRRLPDEDCIMVLSEIDQHGWDSAIKLIDIMKKGGY
jgi:hypothetical protein